MSWLTRIEAVYGIEMEKFTSDSALHIIRRMARVIRNMAAFIRYESNTLSDDALEVINDTTAPRST